MDTAILTKLLTSPSFHMLLSLDIGLSLILFFIYCFDKSRAKKGGWRVPEKRLHFLSLLGGWPGALLGQQICRHKTKKTSFRITFFLTLALNLLFQGWLIGKIIH